MIATPAITAESTQLRERVAFDKRVPGQTGDDLGTTRLDWEQQFIVAARIMPRVGGEAVQASRLSGVQPVIITVRYSNATKTIQPDWRARDVRSGLIYNIRTVANVDERRRELDLMADTGGAV